MTRSIFRSTPRSRRHRPQHQEAQPETQTAFFQPKLSINEPGDPYEREADAVADAVVNQGSKPAASQGQTAVQRMPISSVQRLATPEEDKMPATNDQRMAEDKKIQEKPEEGGGSRVEGRGMVQKADMKEEEPVQKMDAPKEEEQPVQKAGMEEEEPVQAKEEEEPLQAKEEEEPVQAKSQPGASQAPLNFSARLGARRGQGAPLPAKARAQMEQGIGADFSQVRIHTDSEAVQMNKNIHAQAFTHGRDVYFNSGKYSPESTEGKRLLAHELTHVVQQGEASPRAVYGESRTTVSSVPVAQRRIQRCKLSEPLSYSDLEFNSFPKFSKARFLMNATFEHEADEKTCKDCEVRQYIRWDEQAAESFGPSRVPHNGFAKDEGLDKWAEDKDDIGNKYGHRDTPMRHSRFSDPNQADGCTFDGNDNPQMNTEDAKGRWWFKLQAVKNNADIGAPDILTIDWQAKRIVKGFILDKNYPAEEERREELIDEIKERKGGMEKEDQGDLLSELEAELNMQGRGAGKEKPGRRDEVFDDFEQKGRRPGGQDQLDELDAMLAELSGQAQDTDEERPAQLEQRDQKQGEEDESDMLDKMLAEFSTPGKKVSKEKPHEQDDKK